MRSDPRSGATPVVFGEVLFDHFADGSRVLGGAPFNVAWHLQGFGHAPLTVTAVGADGPGKEAQDRMRAWGMRTDGVQVDVRHPTGRVAAKLVAGQPTFEIGTQQAYDYVDADRAAAVAGGVEAALMYHGTLALRGDRTWRALKSVGSATGAPTYVDLNLRAPWWTRDRLRWCLTSATWLKLSEEELATALNLSPRELQTADACAERAQEVAEAHGVAMVLVTRGAAGSLLVTADHVDRCDAPALAHDEIADTVGAGDGFSAVACVGILEGWSAEQILGRANAFAADLCRIRGATTDDRALYERHRRAWGASR